MPPEAKPDYPIGGRTRLKRRPDRGRYDRATVHAILDGCAICQIGYLDAGQPLVLPTIYWRDDEAVFWHGSHRSRALLAMADAEVCFTVARLDGLVLARSAFRHSANYRAVMAFGVARPIEGSGRKAAALRAMIERLHPGRWDRIRPPDEAELAAVTVLRLELQEVSAKIRDEGPLDLESDLDRPVWAGVAPLRLEPGPLEPCATLSDRAETVEAELNWSALGVGGR